MNARRKVQEEALDCGTDVISAAANDPPTCEPELAHRMPQLRFGEEAFPLQQGSSVLGRGPECEIRVDVKGVSRRHARIFIEDDGRVLLEDLGSRNGTFAGEKRVESACELTDTTLIRIGTVWLIYLGGGREKV